MVMATQLSEITISPAAAARVRWIADRKGEADAALRLAVDGGGCSGFTYRFGLAEGIDADDIVTETDGVKLVVDPVSIDLVRGCVVAFVESLGGSSVKVEHPNAASGWGCGTSFSLCHLSKRLACCLTQAMKIKTCIMNGHKRQETRL